MIDFLGQHWGSLLVIALLAMILIGIIVQFFKNKKKGKSTCGCGCAHCPSAGMCRHRAK